MDLLTIILIFLIAIGAVALIHVLFHMCESLEARREAKAIILRAKAEKEAKKILL